MLNLNDKGINTKNFGMQMAGNMDKVTTDPDEKDSHDGKVSSMDKEKVLHILSSVKDLIDQSFLPQGVIAQIIEQDGDEGPFLNVSLT